MSKRQACNICLRPLKTCLCVYVQQVSNQVSLVILQHPLEVHESKNSARILHLCLKNSQIEIGEQLSNALLQKIEEDSAYNLLLYPKTPEEKSLGILPPPEINPDYLARGLKGELPRLRLWVLDATWRKSRKMLYLNPALQAMPRLSLEKCPPSQYKIRKAHSENQLSTLEATCYALQQLEHHTVDYSPVFNAFAAFVTAQHAFLPSSL